MSELHYHGIESRTVEVLLNFSVGLDCGSKTLKSVGDLKGDSYLITSNSYKSTILQSIDKRVIIDSSVSLCHSFKGKSNGVFGSI